MLEPVRFRDEEELRQCGFFWVFDMFGDSDIMISTRSLKIKEPFFPVVEPTGKARQVVVDPLDAPAPSPFDTLTEEQAEEFLQGLPRFYCRRVPYYSDLVDRETTFFGSSTSR